MTGYGHFEDTFSGRNISVEIKSVNHRFFEFSCRVPRAFIFLEDKLRNYVQSRVARGKIDLFLTVESDDVTACEVSLNRALAAGYAKAFEELSLVCDVKNDVTASIIARYPDVFTVRKPVQDEEKLWEEVRSVTEKAVNAFVKMREVEGQKLRDDILSRVDSIFAAVDAIEQAAPETVQKYRERLENKMRELLDDGAVDDQRLLTETAIFADKIAVDEETVRLRSHMSQIVSLLGSSEAVGRKLDFLLQESNREINTIGSKSQNTDISKTVVNVKAELEKIREQIQNIE